MQLRTLGVQVVDALIGDIEIVLQLAVLLLQLG
jgi:hypothetical protein